MLVTIVATLALSPQPMHVVLQRRHRASAQRKNRKPVDEEPAIRAAAKDIERCFETKNWKIMQSRVTSNCQVESPDHKVMSMKQAMPHMKAQLAPLTDIDAEINVQKITINGNMAKLDDRFFMKGKFADKKGKHTIRVEGSETVSLKKVGGRWLAYYVQVHDQSEAIDGRLVSHSP